LPTRTASSDFRLQRWGEARGRAVVDGVLTAAGDLEGATGLAVATGLPFGLAQTTPDATLAAPGTPMPDVRSAIWAPYIAASPELFRVTGISIVAGRAFDGRDTAATEPVVVLSEQTARQVFGTTAVVGREIQVKVDLRVLVRAGQSAPESDIEVRRIIGVASDTDSDFLLLRRSGVVYVPLSQHWEPRVVIVARASDPAAVATRMPAFLRRVDADVAVAGAPGTGPMLLTPQSVLIRMLGSVAAMLGLVSLALALTGLYGVLSHVVASPTREMGIRLALGAEAGRLRRTVLFEGISPVGRGLALGLAFAIVSRLILRATLDFPIAIIDPLPFAGVPALLIAAGVGACHVPARRASRVNPTVALRDL
jgi:putative ABC transport system permease protein